MMSSIEQAILNSFSQLPEQTIYIAYSGGIDSQVLLHATSELITQAKLNKRLVVCHIHHGLSANADSWLAFAEQQSQLYQAQFLSQKVQLATDSGESIEALARDARYHALVEMTELNAVIATGHHQDDQVETFLLALKRGSGLTGLAAMKGQQSFYQRQLVRPLLSISRQNIEAYAAHYQLVWIEDESNNDDKYDRNFLRHNIMPLLTKRWPSIKQTITRSAEHCREAEKLILEITEQDYQQCLESTNALSVSALLALSTARFNYLLRYFIKRHHGLMPSQQQLVELAEQLKAPADKVPALKLGNVWLRRYRNSLCITPEYADLSNWQKNIELSAIELAKPLIMTLPDNVGSLTIARIDGNNTKVENKLSPEQQYVYLDERLTLNLSFSHNNPKCLPDFRDKSRSLKKILQELTIAPWQRKRQLFLKQESIFVGIAGQFICQPFKQASSENSFIKPYLITFIRNN